MNAYMVLGVDPTASAAQIKAAYRARARALHPDRQAAAGRTAAGHAAHESFVELHLAYRAAMAARLTATPGPSAAPALPRQRNPRPVRGTRPAPQRQADDPMLALLTLPHECRDAWSPGALEVWALTLVPEARRHLPAARELAAASGARSSRHRTLATVHALLTLTLHAVHGPRVMGVAAHLPAAYDALERQLPTAVLDGLPARLLPAGPDAGTPRRSLGAFLVSAGLLTGLAAWTDFFGLLAR